MGRTIIKLSDGKTDWYLEWSGISDAPRTYGMTLDEFRAYYREEYGRDGFWDFDERMARVAAKGTSSLDSDDLASVVGFNRAGAGETCLTVAQLIDSYCVRRDEKPPKGHEHKADKDGCSSADDCAVFSELSKTADPAARR